MSIQPKNTGDILVDTIKEKTSSTGVTIAFSNKFTSAGIFPVGVGAVIDIGTSTSASTHYRNVYTTAARSAGQALSIGTDSAHRLTFFTSNATRAYFSGADFTQDASGGGNLLWTKTNSAVAQSVVSGITATGTVIGDAQDLIYVFNRVTTTPASTGVQLWDAPIGATIRVWNTGANALLVYPHDGAGTMNGGTGGAAVSIATNSMGIFTRLSSTDWIAVEQLAAVA